MATQATQPGVMRPGPQEYEKLGYVAYYGGPSGCCGVISAQLEYDTDDHAIAELAQALGDRGEAATFAGREQNWQNSFDAGSGYFELKSVGGLFRSANSPVVPYAPPATSAPTAPPSSPTATAKSTRRWCPSTARV